MTDVKDAEGIYCKFNVTMISPHSLPICLYFSLRSTVGKVYLFWKASEVRLEPNHTTAKKFGFLPIIFVSKRTMEGDAMTMCPRTICSQKKSRTFRPSKIRPLDDAALGY